MSLDHPVWSLLGFSLPGNVGSQDVKDVQVAGTGASGQAGRVGQRGCGSIQLGRLLAAA